MSFNLLFNTISVLPLVNGPLKMLSKSIVYFKWGYLTREKLLIGTSLIIDLNKEKMIELNSTLIYITILPNDYCLFSNLDYLSIYKYPFDSIQEEIVLKVDYIFVPCVFAIELSNKNILISRYRMGLSLYDKQKNRIRLRIAVYKQLFRFANFGTCRLYELIKL